jgi:replicative DNA helicase
MSEREKAKTLADILPTWKDNLFNGTPPARHKIGEIFNSVLVASGQVLLIGAPPSWGKTSLVMSWAFDFLYLQPDLRACVMNVEMMPADLLCREVARQSGVGLTDLNSRAFRNVENYRQDVQEATEKLSTIKNRLTFVPYPFTIEHLYEVVKEHRSDFIVLDYIQRITLDGKPVKDPRQQNGDCMTQIRKIANGGRAVIVVSAVARDKTNGKAYSNLTLGSFRESGELEYGADSGYLLERNVDYFTLRNVKARNTPTKDIDLVFDGDCQRWSQAVKGAE